MSTLQEAHVLDKMKCKRCDAVLDECSQFQSQLCMECYDDPHESGEQDTEEFTDHAEGK